MRLRKWWLSCRGRSPLSRGSSDSQTLRNWVNKYRRTHADAEPPLDVSERARLRQLEKENRELRLEKEFMGKAAAFFAREYR